MDIIKFPDSGFHTFIVKMSGKQNLVASIIIPHAFFLTSLVSVLCEGKMQGQNKQTGKERNFLFHSGWVYNDHRTLLNPFLYLFIFFISAVDAGTRLTAAPPPLASPSLSLVSLSTIYCSII